MCRANIWTAVDESSKLSKIYSQSHCDNLQVNCERTSSSYRHFKMLEQQSEVPAALVNHLLVVLSLKRSTHCALAPVDLIYR